MLEEIKYVKHLLNLFLKACSFTVENGIIITSQLTFGFDIWFLPVNLHSKASISDEVMLQSFNSESIHWGKLFEAFRLFWI